MRARGEACKLLAPCQVLTSAAWAGATVFAVLELQYTKRGMLKAELAATYNWAPDGELRPLYEYTWEGPPLAPDDSDDGT